MPDIAQILLLPPPPPARPPAPAAQDRDVAAASNGGGQDQARARRFRFRVYEGGEGAQANTQYDARRAGSTQRLTAIGASSTGPATRDSQSGAAGQSRTYFSGSTGFGASSAFVAQSIAQEQLGEGLHNPPNAEATTAYTRAGTALSPRPSAGLDVTA